MNTRGIKKTVKGFMTTDGAGVRLQRVIGHRDVQEFDPFLMLDVFDSYNPEDYIAGFPMHPHRGIETITYLILGGIDHEDSMGNRDTIRAGESQWMTAGSGILHQEMPRVSQKMLGFQLWLNLPREEKMANPHYLRITQAMIPAVKTTHATVRVLSGRYNDAAGVTPLHIPATLFDVALLQGGNIELPAPPEENAFLFLMEGDAVIGGSTIPAKSAVLFGEGDTVSVSAGADTGARFAFFCAKPLREPVAWGGPIVMNTREELEQAYDELRRGKFIRRG